MLQELTCGFGWGLVSRAWRNFQSCIVVFVFNLLLMAAAEGSDLDFNLHRTHPLNRDLTCRCISIYFNHGYGQIPLFFRLGTSICDSYGSWVSTYWLLDLSLVSDKRKTVQKQFKRRRLLGLSHENIRNVTWTVLNYKSIFTCFSLVFGLSTSSYLFSSRKVKWVS